MKGEGVGNLVIKDSWPGQMRTVYGDHQRCIDTYLSTYDGFYTTGVDDVLNVSGHRMGTAEVESAMVGHDSVAEAAVVGYPHDVKGQGIYVYVTLMEGVEPSDDLKGELRKWVRKEIGPIATPDLIQWAPSLPKTRSGKIMRRILRKIAEDDFGSLGDTSRPSRFWSSACPERRRHLNAHTGCSFRHHRESKADHEDAQLQKPVRETNCFGRVADDDR